MTGRTVRMGVDLGGTKIECAAVAADGSVAWRERVPTPKGDYRGTIAAIAGLVERCERELALRASVGVGMPGSVSPRTGLQRNANSTVLNGQPFVRDLSERLGRPIRATNDANCFALSEAIAGAARDARVVFGAILGTGVGGGVVLDGQVVEGRNGVGGEWGHNPMPPPIGWRRGGAAPASREARPCYCGLTGCREQYISGPAIERGHAERTGSALDLRAIATRAADDPACADTIARLVDDVALSLAEVVNILDPDCIVLGGGVSNVDALYALLPDRVASLAFTDSFATPIRRAERGDSSGVFGAAMLWPA